MKKVTDGLSKSDMEIRPHHLLCTVCALGGVECPLLGKDRIDHILDAVGRDPTLRIKLASNADEIVYFKNIRPEDYARMDTQEVFIRKRDLDVLQKLAQERFAKVGQGVGKGGEQHVGELALGLQGVFDEGPGAIQGHGGLA